MHERDNLRKLCPRNATVVIFIGDTSTVKFTEAFGDRQCFTIILSQMMQSYLFTCVLFVHAEISPDRKISSLILRFNKSCYYRAIKMRVRLWQEEGEKDFKIPRLPR